MTEHWIPPPAPAASRATDRAAHAFELVAGWMFSAPMAGMLGEFGKQLPGSGAAGRRDAQDMTGWLHLNEELPDWVDHVVDDDMAQVAGLSSTHADILRRTLAVERMAADKFNFRGRDGQQYKERSQAVAGNFRPEVRDRILALADQLGLVTPEKPRLDRYDKTLIMGGGYQSPLLRARHAVQLRDQGTDLGEISFLGSPRFLIEEPPERSVTEPFAPGATDEFDLMVGGAHAELMLTPAKTVFLCGCSSAEAQCPKWPGRGSEAAAQTPAAYTHERRVDLLDSAGSTAAWVLSARTGRPPYRPDTSDTFALWARCANPRPGQRILAVTTQVFVPFQTFDGLRRLYLPYGVDIDVVGYPADWGYPPKTAEYLLQEALSAVRSGRRLLIAAVQTLMGVPSPA